MGLGSSSSTLMLALLAVIALLRRGGAQLSNPVLTDAQIDSKSNKFLTRKPTADKHEPRRCVWWTDRV